MPSIDVPSRASVADNDECLALFPCTARDFFHSIFTAIASLLQAMPEKLGTIAEELAAAYFLERDYLVMEKNFRAGPGEIDLILEKDGVIVFVEVKARRSLRYGLPQEAVTHSKQQTIRRVAEAYLQQKKKVSANVRFDVLAITFKGKGTGHALFDHIPHAF